MKFTGITVLMASFFTTGRTCYLRHGPSADMSVVFLMRRVCVNWRPVWLNRKQLAGGAQHSCLHQSAGKVWKLQASGAWTEATENCAQTHRHIPSWKNLATA